MGETFHVRSADERAGAGWGHWLGALLIGVATLSAAMVMHVRPAAALTNNEKFVWAVYEDFLLREPEVDEVTWWSAYLSSHSRSSMVASVLDLEQFKGSWVIGASIYYLGEIDPNALAISDALETSDDFVASEVALLAGSTYFANKGGTNTSFVENLYYDALLRAVDAPSLSYWVGRLDAATATRASVASSIIRSTESAQRRVGGASGMTTCTTTTLSDATALAAGSYCIVLDRMADSGGISYWSGQLAASDQLPSLWASLAGSTEYYNNALARF